MYSKNLQKRMRMKGNFLKFYKIEAKRTSSLVIAKKKKNEKKRSFVFLEQSEEKRI